MTSNPFKNSKPFLKNTYENIKGDLRVQSLRQQILSALSLKGMRVSTVADIGCGSAPVSKLLLKDFPIDTAYFFDSSEDILNKAKEAIKSEGIPTACHFNLSDFEASLEQIDKNPVDLIICHGVLNWLDEPEKGLLRLMKTAKATGAAVSLMVGSKTGYLLELASKGRLEEINSLIKTDQVASESYPDKSLFLFNPLDLLRKIEADGEMKIIAKSAVRVVYDLLPADVQKTMSFDELFHLESGMSSQEEYWALGDMTHVVFHNVVDIVTDKYSNVFQGENSVLDLLNPDNAPYTPLVEIPTALNPFKDKGVRIFAKLMSALPLANVKSLPAYNMLLDKKTSGGLEGVNTVIENSSGNTVFSLAVIARLMGIPNTKAVVSHEVTKGKLNLLRFLGTEIIVNEEPICPDPSDPTSGIYKSKVWAKENNWFNPGQYDNEANPAAHYKWTGPQIWNQTKGKVSLLSVGLGTTGSVVGLGSFLKQKNKEVEMLGVTRIINNPVPGVRTKGLLKEVAFDWESNMDYHEEVGTVESFGKSMELCRAGILVGPSSGFALMGMLNHLSKQDLSSREEKIAVFICPDSPFPYIDEYFEFLDEKEFPKIENGNLLKSDHSFTPKQNVAQPTIQELTSEEVFSMVFAESSEIVWNKVKVKEEVPIRDGYRIIDVRTDGEYEDHHIPGSEHINFYDIDMFLKKDKSLKKAKGVIFVCRRGNSSRLAAYKAEQLGIKAISLRGGDAEWSRLNLPRIRSEKCIIRYDLS